MPTTVETSMKWMLSATGVIPRTLGWRFHPDTNSLTIKGYEGAVQQFEVEISNLKKIRKQIGMLVESTNLPDSAAV